VKLKRKEKKRVLLSVAFSLYIHRNCQKMEGGDDAPMVQIDRKSSIENEPRTLTFDQIQYAREEAMYVVSTRSIEEALRIFTEGLEPVANMVGKHGDMMMDTGRDTEHLDRDYQHHMRLPDIRDVATAPF
ncbi:hypothetical protein Tsubulata_011168, partial [Turnera subulata]